MNREAPTPRRLASSSAGGAHPPIEQHPLETAVHPRLGALALDVGLDGIGHAEPARSRGPQGRPKVIANAAARPGCLALALLDCGAEEVRIGSGTVTIRKRRRHLPHSQEVPVEPSVLEHASTCACRSPASAIRSVGLFDRHCEGLSTMTRSRASNACRASGKCVWFRRSRSQRGPTARANCQTSRSWSGTSREAWIALSPCAGRRGSMAHGRSRRHFPTRPGRRVPARRPIPEAGGGERAALGVSRAKVLARVSPCRTRRGVRKETVAGIVWRRGQTGRSTSTVIKRACAPMPPPPCTQRPSRSFGPWTRAGSFPRDRLVLWQGRRFVPTME